MAHAVLRRNRLTIALVVSLGSFGVSALNAFRDRPRVKVTGTFYEASEYNMEPYIAVQVVNRGRRPVILRMVGGFDSSGNAGGEYMEYDKGGLRLGEHERYEFNIEKEKAVMQGPDGPEDPFVQMFIEDSLGNRHAIPRSGEYLKKLFS